MPIESRVDAQRESVDVVRDLVVGLGAYARGHREAIALLVEGSTLADVVRRTALPRRLVEELLRAIGPDLDRRGDQLRIDARHAEAYREVFRTARLAATAVDQIGDDLVRTAGDLSETVTRILDAAPRPKRALDHVPATVATAVRRGLWLDGTYDLAGATMLCVGDHDLTSVVTCLVNPEARVLVVDIDEDLLAYIDRVAAEHGLRIDTSWADLRTGLPEHARQAADLVFTDPPYTPDGVRLFLGRGAEGLRDRASGRLVMAYGYGSHHPGLGYNVQRAVGDLHLVYEAILPHFNRYVGAQAVGSASDLYVLRPTTRTWRALEAAPREDINIYTHGAQSAEAADGRDDLAVREALSAAASADGITVAGAVLTPGTGGATRVPLADVLSGRAGARIPAARDSAMVGDLSDDPGSWLYRFLLGSPTRRAVVVVPNGHPDLADQAGQDALRDDLADRWTLTFRRSTPDARHAVVIANEAVGPAGPAEVARRVLLGGAARRLANAWRDALVKAARSDGTPLGKERAREIVSAAARAGGLRDALLDRPLTSLPRRTIRQVLALVVGSVDATCAAPVAPSAAADGNVTGTGAAMTSDNG